MKKDQKDVKIDFEALEKAKAEFFANGGKVKSYPRQPASKFDLDDDRSPTEEKESEVHEDTTDDSSTYTEIKLE